jgi:hypothetical protein
MSEHHCARHLAIGVHPVHVLGERQRNSNHRHEGNDARCYK